jgi:hypothetical protein
MKLWALGAVLAISGAVGAAGPQAALPSATGDDFKITGCVVKGEGGHVLLPLDDGTNRAGVVPPAGTSGGSDDLPATMRVLYWLDEDDIDDHAGQRVEITGELEDDVEIGEVEVERRDDGFIDVEFKSGGEEISVRLPDAHGAGTSGGIGDDEKKYEYVVRKVDVKDVKVLASVCQ